ncbi:RICIN domain-containing protein [Streptomyces gamaensis]|uniref:RICIN domain-containing protein n=1 Tax=Streptomyces gamaensis TaxID=1763542 RepID=A0ABW0ZB48_9ACTN
MKLTSLAAQFGAAAASVVLTTIGLSATASAAPPPADFPVEVRLADTNKCLDVPGANAYDGAPATIYDCNGTSAQTWMLQSLNSDSSHFVLKNWGKCLDVPWANSYNGAQLQVAPCNYSTAQQFWGYALGFVDRLNNSIGDATRCVDSPNGNLNNGTRVQLWDCHGGLNQKWEIRRR